MRTALAILIAYSLMSAVTLIVYALDKRAAGRGARRTRESTLHTLALLGGWPGALAGVHLVRHKSRKVPFLAVLYATVTLHAAVFGAVLWWRASA